MSADRAGYVLRCRAVERAFVCAACAGSEPATCDCFLQALAAARDAEGRSSVSRNGVLLAANGAWQRSRANKEARPS